MYYHKEINEAEGYGVTSSLLGRVKDNLLSLHTSNVALANDF